MSVDLAQSKFWLVLLAAWLLLTPLNRQGDRVRLLALLNVAFVAWVVSPISALVTVLAVGCLVVALHRLKRPESRVPVVLAIGLLGLALFLTAKLPVIAGSLTVPEFRTGLLGIGYSYVFLRGLNLARAVAERPDEAPDWLSAINYLIPFHMLAAGPIQSYEDYRTALVVTELSQENTLSALERISSGLFKKFVLAECLSRVVLTQFQHPDPLYLLLEVQANYLWLYLDFSGYSDIAVGVGQLIGFRTPENFHRPLTSANLIEFWERWHITLSRFIKLNIFLPLQFWAARRVHGRWPLWIGTFSFLISFVLCGLWHDISWRFFLWGLLHGLGLAVCKVYQNWAYRKFGKKRLRSSKILRICSTVLTFEFIALSWMLVSVPEGTWVKLTNFPW